MRLSWIELLLWLYVLDLGIACGAGLYESRIMVPQWLVGSQAAGYHWNRAAAAEANVGLRFWVYVSTGPLTLLTLAGVVALWYVPPPLRNWWMLAVGVGLLERGLTFGYFIPTMVRLSTDTTMTDADAVAKALTWGRLGYVRHAANIIGLLAALKAFALFYARGAGKG
jgi:hypothetical protein